MTAMSAKGRKQQPPLLDGRAITFEIACELRRLTCGSTVTSFGMEWKKTGFVFYPLQSPFQFGLQIPRNCTRGLLVCVQAYLLKQMIFRYANREEILRRDVLHPTEYLREEALVNAMSEMLWQAGQGATAQVCLLQELIAFDIPLDYKKDGFTEKLILFNFTTIEELRSFIKTNKEQFQRPLGAILFLYSIILSRTSKGIKDDSGDTDIRLLSESEELSGQTLLNLLLTGRAVKYIFNGNRTHDDTGVHLRDRAMKGIETRSEIGFLYYDKLEAQKDPTTMIGSMYKTPKRPIWVTITNRVNYGLLFSTNPDLVSDWRVEHRFSLHYYTGLLSQPKAVTLTVDTSRHGQRSIRRGSHREHLDDLPALDHLIMSKWADAEIDWNGTQPFM